MAATISALVTTCLTKLKQLSQSDGLNQYNSEVSPALWADELGRLRVWAANIGAHQTGQSSLDFRLRDSSSVRQTVVRVLERLQRTMEDLQDVLGGSKVTEEDSTSDFSDSEKESEQTEIQSIYYSLRDTITKLFQASMVIRRPAQYDRLIGTKRSDAAMFEPFDKDHVSNKFPSVDEVILKRLGLANSQRRAILRYRARHHMKLAQGIDQSDTMSETVAIEFVESPEHESGYDSQSITSRTSYAKSLVQGNHGIGMPAPPEGSDNKAPFECPYCYVIISISSSLDWYRHVFNDLMPYVCVIASCLTPYRLYQSRREWSDHLKGQHSMMADSSAGADCPLCNSPDLPARSLEKHLGRHLEELALFVLPKSDQDKDQEECDSSSSSLSPVEMPSLNDEEREEILHALRQCRHIVSERDKSHPSSKPSVFEDANPSIEATAERTKSPEELREELGEELREELRILKDFVMTEPFEFFAPRPTTRFRHRTDG